MVERPLDQFASLLPLEACEELKTAPQGLAEAEAHARLEHYGPNTISDDFHASAFGRIVQPFANWITLILLIAAALALLSDTPVIGYAIFAVALLNGIFTIWQEFLAERAISALRRLLPPQTFVRRNGQVRTTPSAEVVPGDILPLKPGTVIVADCYLITSENLRVRQTILTGNTALITKVAGALPDQTLAITERPNVVLAGTSVYEGQGSAMVVATGMRTLLGKIAESTAALHENQTPLGRALRTLAGTISRVAIAAGIATFGLTVLGRQLDFHDGIIFAIGIIVAFVPEGLLPTVSLALALARRRLQRYGVLAKRLAGVESLGSATIVCLDRADVLGEGLLTSTSVWAGGQPYQVTGIGFAPEGTFLRDHTPVDVANETDLAELLRAASLCNNARLLPPEGDQSAWQILGDITEGALQVAAAKARTNVDHMRRLYSFPYDPRRRLTSAVFESINDPGQIVAYVRGDATAIIALCTGIRRNGAVAPLDDAGRTEVQHQIDTYARAGQRVVALAARPMEPATNGFDWRARNVEHDLTLLGLIALEEPPQPEVTQLIQGCQRAGIRVLVVTSGYGLTAEAGARRAGIITAPRARLIQGAELNEMSASDLTETLADDQIIFAQVDAEQKQRIVIALQARGDIVAFLGDSVNDAPALKKADIGVAVSGSGTAVALAAADIVLDAAHPAGLLVAIQEGRAIFSNIQKFTTYIFTHNAAETLTVLVSAVFGLPLPLTVLQVLAIDLGTEVLPSIALSTEAPEPDILDQPPRPANAPLIDQTMLFRAFIWLGMLEGVLAMLAYFMGYWSAGWRPGMPLASMSGAYAQATTLTYMGIVLAQAGNAFASRTRKTPIWQVGLLTNRPLIAGVLASIVLMVVLIYVPPLAQIFGFVPPEPIHWLVLATFPVIMLLAEEARKWWERTH